MAKKYFASFNKNKKPISVKGPYYGELTETMVQRMIEDAPRGCDNVFEISRRTDGIFVTIGYYDIKKGNFTRATAPNRYGPGYY